MVHLTTALEPGSGVPLYEQLYRSLAGEMRTGALPAGTRMPGKRRLAAELSVSVNTVDTAYQMLAAEGYLAARERSGFYVQEYLALPQVGPDARGPSPAPAVPEPAAPEPPVRYDLSTRGVDPGLFPFRTWARLQKELLYSSPELLTNGDAQGDLALRQALADYLAEYRGVQCGAHQVVVGAGLEYLLGLLAPLLHGTAAVETPGYPRALQVLENTGMRCCCLPVDEGGLSLDALDRSGAAGCYVTPSHQFPTGVTMPAGRRAELLHWAARRPGQRYIIEDDYDSEFRFDTRPLPSLQGMAGADGPVVYLSTCSRSLAPGIRIAYMVLPEHLLPAWHAKYRLYSGTVSRFEQQTLARFITGGYFTRHLALAIQSEVNEELVRRLNAGEVPHVRQAFLANAQSKVLLVEFDQEIAEKILDAAPKFGAAPHPVGSESKYEFAPMIYRVSGTFRAQDPTIEHRMIRINPMRSGPDTIIRILRSCMEQVEEN